MNCWNINLLNILLGAIKTNGKSSSDVRGELKQQQNSSTLLHHTVLSLEMVTGWERSLSDSTVQSLNELTFPLEWLWGPCVGPMAATTCSFALLLSCSCESLSPQLFEWH